MYPNGICPNCGGRYFGDGIKTVLYCEFAEDEEVSSAEPNSGPLPCKNEKNTSRCAETTYLRQKKDGASGSRV